MADNVGGFCGLRTWTSHSRIAHATAKSPLGPFARKDIALKQEAHNASPLRGKDGWWYLFHIGDGSGHAVSNCTEASVAEATGSSTHSATQGASGSPAASGSFLHRAKAPEGPWEALPNLGCNNPAPMIHHNGTFFVGCNDGGFKIYRSEGDPSLGNWTKVVTLVFPPKWGGGHSPYIRCEDPYLWMDKRGSWHFISHNYDYRDGWPANPNQTMPVLVAGHGYSTDGITWRFSTNPPYNSWVDFDDGHRQMFATMERPHLVFGSNGDPTHILNGVSSVWDAKTPCHQCDARPGSQHSCVVCKTSAGVDWTYTLARPLVTK